MNSKVLKLLEYDKIIQMLLDRAGSSLARDAIGRIEPLSNGRMIKDALTETTEAVSVIVSKGNIPIGEFGDIADLLTMARKGRSLSMRELLAVKRTMSVVREVKSFITADDMPETKTISEIGTLLVPVPKLESEIDRCILSDDEMSDNASSELKRIRREIRQKNDSVKTRLARFTESASMKKYLQDAIVTMRNGRYVIPVKKEYASLVPGLVHDQSQTGATLFIEPAAIVNLNNELRELEGEERREIERILLDLSGRVAEHYNDLNNDQKLLIELDVISAKGKMSCDMDAVEPEILEIPDAGSSADGEGGEETASGSAESVLLIRGGRHPLIPADKVVPIDVELGGEFDTLLITGPNTGGKTVTLKTIGLFCLMALSGLHIPCCEGSRIPVLNEVYADIGDEQSIEQSLSTFSSHMSNIVNIMRSADKDTLVLLDELGAGTDPTEGAALGIAEIESLRRAGSMVVATTHYTELKKYALSTDGVENASMEFDVETLSPTYKLRLGLPGKSNAFEISRKLGLDEAIIDRAKDLLDEEAMSFEKAISAVEADRQRAEEQLFEANEAKAAAEEKLKKVEEKLAKAEERGRSIVEDAKEEARSIIRDAHETVDEISRELKEIRDRENAKSGTGSGGGEGISAVAASRRKLRETDAELRTEAAEARNDRAPLPEQLKTGTLVKLLTIDQNGEVLTVPDDRGNLTVQIGSIKMNANIKDLIIVQPEPEGNKAAKRKAYSRAGKSGAGRIRESKVKNISPQINVIGKNLDTAVADVEKYLDDAYIAGLRKVTIVHGRGEGILRSGIRDVLKKNKFVKSYERAPYNDGGDGATVVYLKD